MKLIDYETHEQIKKYSGSNLTYPFKYEIEMTRKREREECT